MELSKKKSKKMEVITNKLKKKKIEKMKILKKNMKLEILGVGQFEPKRSWVTSFKFHFPVIVRF